MNIRDSIETLKGVGGKTAALFGKLGIETVGDLLNYYPRTYDEYKEPALIEQLLPECVFAVYGKVRTTPGMGRKMQVVTVKIEDENEDTMELVWFHMPFVRNMIKKGECYIFRGRVVKKGSRFVMEQPEIYSEEQYGEKLHQMQPVYSLTAGISNNTIVKAVRQALHGVEIQKDYLTPEIRLRYELSEYNYALLNIHFPNSQEDFAMARKRLAFDEFYLFILALRMLKTETEASKNSFAFEKESLPAKLLEELPYELTNAQKTVWEEIKKDMTGKTTMARLIQGDVGSGKTILAVLACMFAAENGYQSAFMVPTEVLARQHYESMQELLEEHGNPFMAILLTGSMTAKEKRLAYEKIERGEAKAVIGTHALIQEKVVYDKLALVVTDEQHRFGVKQRDALAKKGMEPHVLVMSATPIPRTLAIIIYGDLDISVIDELPAERLPIKNCVVGVDYRPKAYSFIEREVKAGRQAYIICAMVEESEALDAENVVDYTEKLRHALDADISIEYLHGKMKPKEKNEIMERFSSGEIQVLVSTTVVEVGVNVPNATVMMVENSERFGLAQLHQLRGRVGRGKHQSYCIFVNGSESKHIQKRLNILNDSNDGFYIAEQDMKLRGPGDLFGLRQSGLMEFQVGDIFTDAAVLQHASEAASELLLEDRNLEKEEHRSLKIKLDFYMKKSLGTISL